MKKSKILLVAIVILLSACAGLLTACNVPIDHEEAFKLLKANYEESIKYEIFFSKELIGDKKDKEIINVNSVCTLDKDNAYSKNAEGNYVDHAVQIYSTLNGQLQYETFVGLSKDGKKDPGKNMKFHKKLISINDKKEAKFDYTCMPMTPGEYIVSDEFAPNTLKAKLSEIGRLTRQDIVFDKKGATKTGELIKLKFAVTDSYCVAYNKEYGVDSKLKGTYVTMELLYGRIANLVVMQEDLEQESFLGTPTYESYKLEIVYLGPIIKNIPNYNEKDSTTKENVWKEI